MASASEDGTLDHYLVKVEIIRVDKIPKTDGNGRSMPGFDGRERLKTEELTVVVRAESRSNAISSAELMLGAAS